MPWGGRWAFIYLYKKNNNTNQPKNQLQDLERIDQFVTTTRVVKTGGLKKGRFNGSSRKG